MASALTTQLQATLSSERTGKTSAVAAHLTKASTKVNLYSNAGSTPTAGLASLKSAYTTAADTMHSSLVSLATVRQTRKTTLKQLVNTV